MVYFTLFSDLLYAVYHRPTGKTKKIKISFLKISNSEIHSNPNYFNVFL